MERIPRVVLPEYPRHPKRKSKEKVFFNRGDYQAYLDHIVDGCESAQTQCCAYCMIPSHVHLVLVSRCPDGLCESFAEVPRHYT